MKYYDDDMDELFNKAGRDFPLKIEPKNWEAVRGALHPEDGASEAAPKRDGWKRLTPLLFLLLIPAVYIFIDKDNINNKDNVNNEKSELANITDVSTVANSQQPVKTDSPAAIKKETRNTNKAGERSIIVMDPSISKTGYGDVSRLRGAPKAADVNVERGRGRERETETERERVSKSVSEIVSEKIVSEKYVIGDPKLWNDFPTLNMGFNSVIDPSEVISLKTPTMSLNQSTGLTSVPNSDKKTKNKKGPYIGLIAAPDLSTIKGQEVKGVGYSAGAIVGYNINNHWQVEGGVLWSRKKYYTDGKYFDKTGPGIPDNVNVLSLDGGCEMLEFPIVARYNFSQKKNTFFGSAGLTSYLMKKEDYDYKAQLGSNGYPYEGYRMYNRSGDHLFANLQLSAGYNFSLSSKLNIRIEPYLKTPLKKIGIGKMPITSAGLYFAITRDFR
jgi:hypothetical protein